MTGTTSLFADVNLRAVNRLLLIVALILAAIVAYRIYSLSPSLPPPPSAPQTRAAVPTHSGQDFADVSAYVEQVGRQNIFQLRTFGEPATVDQPEDSDRRRLQARLRELKQSLSIVGVSWREPEMVMLYDQRTNNTYFVQESQTIGETGAEVRNISRGEVTIGIEDEEIML